MGRYQTIVSNELIFGTYLYIFKLYTSLQSFILTLTPEISSSFFNDLKCHTFLVQKHTARIKLV